MKRALTLATFAVLMTPALLAAHAHLTRSSPAAGERLERPPERLSLWFSESPELRFTTIQLLDSADNPIAIGPVTRIAQDPSGVGASLVTAIGAGRYTVAWKTAASDGHLATGRFAFTVLADAGDTARVSPRPAQLQTPAPAKSNEIVSTVVAQQPLNTAEHWALLVAVFTVIGAIGFRGAVITRAGWDSALVGDASDGARRLAQGALALALVASLTRLAAEASLMTGSTPRMRSMWDVASDTAWGHGWLVGAAGIVIAALALSLGWRKRIGWLIAALGALALALSQSLTGHAGASMDWLTVSVTADVVHLLAAGAWVGGLVSVILVGLPVTRRHDEADRPARGSSLVRAYHDIALPSVIVVALSGLANSWLRLGNLAALWTSAYGRVLIAKVFLFLIIATFGYYHWRTVVTAGWGAATAGRFRRTALLELLVGALVLMATAGLISMATPEHAAHAR